MTTGTPEAPDPNAILATIANLNILQTLRDCRWDMHRFAFDILGVEAHSGQDALFEAAIARQSDGHSPSYLTVCTSAGNRAGKTLGLAIVVLHQTLYKMGIPSPFAYDDSSLRAWTTAPFDWYHFGISQEVTELLHLEMVRLLTGVHEAQKGRGCPLTEALGDEVAEYTKKERGEWAWFKWSELLGGAEIHFRTTGEKALSTLGRDMNGWSYDEPAFDPNLTFVFDEVLNLRRMSTGGQAFLIATATEGSLAYEELWLRGDPLAPDRQPDYISIRISTRQNVGYGIDAKMFDRMLATIPETLVPQNIDGYFIEARSAYFAAESVNRAFDRGRAEGLEEKTPVRKGRSYAHGVDPALTYDSTWSIVLDVTANGTWYGVSIARRTGRQTASGIVALVSEVHHEYNANRTCSTGIDATGFGGKIFASLLRESRTPARSIEFGGRSHVKLKMLANLKTALDSGKLVLPRHGLWLVLRRQLLNYKLADRKLETDAVMALVVAIKMATSALYGDTKPLPFEYFAALPSGALKQSAVDVPSDDEEPPRNRPDDRVLRLDRLSTARVASLGSLFKR